MLSKIEDQIANLKSLKEVAEAHINLNVRSKPEMLLPSYIESLKAQILVLEAVLSYLVKLDLRLNNLQNNIERGNI